MEGVLSEETDSQTIRVKFDSIVEQNAELLGIFYQRVSSKKFFQMERPILCCGEIN